MKNVGGGRKTNHEEVSQNDPQPWSQPKVSTCPQESPSSTQNPLSKTKHKTQNQKTKAKASQKNVSWLG